MSVKKLPVFLLFPAVLMLVTVCMAADFKICARCGYESPSEKKICSHCNTEFPGQIEAVAEKSKPEAEDNKGHSFGADGKLATLDSSAVKEEIKQGKLWFDKGNIELARLIFRNAAALEMLVDKKAEGQRSDRIGELIMKCDSLPRMVEIKCTDCGGSTRKVTKMASLSGEPSISEGLTGTCPRCAGSGRILKQGTIDDWKSRRGTAVSEYTTFQQGRKYAPLGGAWVPPEIEGKLSAKQAAALKRTAASPCAACLGIGKQMCGTCNGSGEVKCSGRGCVDGTVTVEVKSGLSGGSASKPLTRKDKCKACAGRSLAACQKCGGQGGVICSKCNGTRERPLCEKCSGQGFAPCKKCSGTGNVKDGACPECSGEGVAMCSSCSGDGRNK